MIKGISRLLQKLLKYFNGTIISTSFVPLLSSVWPVIFSLESNKSVQLSKAKSTVSPLLFTGGMSLQYCHKLPNNL